MDKLDAVVAGAGAAGIACALVLARGGAKVLLLEKGKGLGRKILLSGNGRCNITNVNVSEDKYYGGKKLVKSFLPSFGFEQCAEFLRSAGILIREEEGGRCFPVSGRAADVKDAFELCLAEVGARVEFGAEADYVSKKDFFEVRLTDGRTFASEYLVLACGSPAYAPPGGGGAAAPYSLAKSLGHTAVPAAPAMSAVEIAQNVKDLHGLRLHASITLNAQTETGEIIFSNNNLSGLPVLSLSRNAEPGSQITINFYPQLEKKAFYAYIKERAAAFGERKMADFLTGILPPAAAHAALRAAQIPKTVLAGRISAEKLKEFAETLQNFPLTVKKVKGLESAMSARGGINTEEINENFSSKKQRNLFIIGEMLDVDAKCGGYSLHFAFGSGVKAAQTVLGNLCPKKKI